MDNNIKNNDDTLGKLLTKVNRVEVIDENGRSYVNWNLKNQVYAQLQDEDRTLKIFITTK